jgi:hypothetical protein
VNESEPNRRAAQQQRVQQQIQIQIAIHNDNVAITPGHVKWFLIRVVVSALYADLIEPQARRYTFPSGKPCSTKASRFTNLAA